MTKKAIIDCDAGVDDALALILALHSTELEVLAITGVSGNVPLDVVFDNIKKILLLLQPQHRPFIAKGADRPLSGHTVHAHSVHGRDGLGGARIERSGGGDRWQIYAGRADELIAEMIREHPDELTFIATGPLTNLALGLQTDREGMRRLKEVAVMGGAVRTKGNITPHAEFNIYNDPLAAQMVFESGLPITLVPLDVTHQVFLTPQAIEERVRPINSPISQFVMEASGYDLRLRRFRGRGVPYLHDPLAVGVAIDTSLVRKERLTLHVETQAGDRYGQTSEVSGEGSAEQNLEVCLGVDSERFLELFLSRLG